MYDFYAEYFGDILKLLVQIYLPESEKDFEILVITMKRMSLEINSFSLYDSPDAYSIIFDNRWAFMGISVRCVPHLETGIYSYHSEGR